MPSNLVIMEAQRERQNKTIDQTLIDLADRHGIKVVEDGSNIKMTVKNGYQRIATIGKSGVDRQITQDRFVQLVVAYKVGVEVATASADRKPTN